MKNTFLLLSLMIASMTTFASYCPNGKQYEEMQSYGKPDTEQEKHSLTEKMTKDLKNKYPNTSIVCDLKDNKYYYCVACPE